MDPIAILKISFSSWILRAEILEVKKNTLIDISIRIQKKVNEFQNAL